MPTYAYECESCSYRHDYFQKISDEPLKTCPSCGKDALFRIPSGGIGLSFKGSGFYITDYVAKGGAEKQSTPQTAAATGKCCPCGSDKGCKQES